MAHLCKDAEKAERDAVKAAERQAEGKTTYICKKCSRPSHKEDHLCKAKVAETKIAETRE